MSCCVCIVAACFKSSLTKSFFHGNFYKRTFYVINKCVWCLLSFSASCNQDYLYNVTSPYGNVLHHKENVTHGQFAFTSSESGQYMTCFWPDRPNEGGALSVNIDWKIGVAAKDWESVARKEKIEGVELELRKLEGAVEAIHDNLLYLKSREAEMRGVSETTNSRVAWYSIISLGICILASCAQLWYLTRFFQKKKLI
ncbi:putative transmembrane emp24 domain-containing protein [Helianthus annuus]|nr:putative transmembrane emp24 domain-containing protein [Helianthus annuus]